MLHNYLSKLTSHVFRGGRINEEDLNSILFQLEQDLLKHGLSIEDTIGVIDAVKRKVSFPLSYKKIYNLSYDIIRNKIIKPISSVKKISHLIAQL